MFEFIINNLSFFLFIIFLSIFLFIKRKKVEVQGSFPFLYMILYKTSLGLDKMNGWANKHQKIFLGLSYYSIFIGIAGIFLSIAMMVWGIDYALANNLGSGGGLVLPIQTDSGMDGTIPVFYVPFWYWLIALFVLVIVHEFAHGVIAERFKIKVKSSGFAFGALFLPIMPAAFVEPDEKSLKKAKPIHQIAVFGAGSASNFLFGFLFLLIWIFLLVPFVDNTMQVKDIKFSSVMNQSDLNNFNISSGYLESINGYSNKDNLLNYIHNISPNQNINISIKNINNNLTNTYSIKTFSDPKNSSKAMIGISGININFGNKEQYNYLGKIPLYLEKLFYYFWLLNLGIGIMNLLPLWITDGGQITRVLLSRKFKKKLAMRLYNYISLFSLILIIFTIKPSLLIWIISLF